MLLSAAATTVAREAFRFLLTVAVESMGDGRAHVYRDIPLAGGRVLRLNLAVATQIKGRELIHVRR